MSAGALQFVRTTLTLGVQLDDFDYRLFLREVHRELRSHFESEDFPAYTPQAVLDDLLLRYARSDGRPNTDGGARHETLREFAQQIHRLDLNLTGSDFGAFEQRVSPYSIDRAFYHLGREIVGAEVKMEHPGYNPYRSTRRINIAFLRDNLDHVIELLPDYIWWEMHDQKDALDNALLPEQIDVVRSRIGLAGYNLDNFGLYLTTMESLRV